TVTVKIKYGDHQLVTRRTTLDRSTSDGRLVADLARTLLAAVPHIERRGVRLSGVTLSGFGGKEDDQPQLDFDTGVSDRAERGEGPIVILLHGFGAPGDDLVPLWRVLDVPRATRFLFPEAPISFSMGFGESRAWWMIDPAYFDDLQRPGPRPDRTGEVP